jgi:cyclin H
MTYHPTSILKTALFFATKTENHYFRLTKFAEAIGKTTPADVLASEFLLTQGLRFTFDVRHPFRALEGAIMELQAIANNTSTISALLGAPPVKVPPELGNLNKRVREAHGKAREYLKTSALLTDVYFHYTPSQIMFSSLLIADPDLTTFYLSLKIPPNTPSHIQLLSILSSCAATLQTVPPSTLTAPSADEMKYLKSLAKKLQKCQNPEMADLIKLNERRKREGGEEGIDEQVRKKRRLERERMEEEGERLFGGSLGGRKDG